MLTCVMVVAHRIFHAYLKCAAKRPNDDVLEAELEQQAQFLLVYFNHISKDVRRCADKCLSLLVDQFPRILWSANVIATALEILQVLLCIFVL